MLIEIAVCGYYGRLSGLSQAADILVKKREGST
jgi:hypothetical protein